MGSSMIPLKRTMVIPLGVRSFRIIDTLFGYGSCWRTEETQARTDEQIWEDALDPRPVINPSPQALCLRFCPECIVSPPAHIGFIHLSWPETQSFTELFTDTSLSESFERGWEALHPMAHRRKSRAYQQTQGSEKSCNEK